MNVYKRAADLRRGIEAMDLRGILALLKPRLSVEVRDEDAWLICDMMFPERAVDHSGAQDAKRWTNVRSEQRITIYPRDVHELIDTVIRPQIMTMFTHEVDECVWFQGAPLRDPHRDLLEQTVSMCSHALNADTDRKFLKTLPKTPRPQWAFSADEYLGEMSPKKEDQE